MKQDELFYIKQPEDKKTIGQRLTEFQLRDLYCDQGKSLADIAKMFNCSNVYILMLMRQYDIPTRNRSAASAQAKRLDKGVRFTAVNDNFFKARTPQMAYVLGCIYSHGAIGKHSTSFSITHEDIEIVNKLKELLGSSHRIKQGKRKRVYTLNIGNMSMTRDLLAFGLSVNNNFERVFPMLEDNLYSHFIRGFFDCSGSVSEFTHLWRISFVSSSKLFVDNLQTVIRNYARTNKRPIYLYKYPEIHQVSYESRMDLNNIFQYMYDDYALEQRLYIPSQYHLFLKHIEISRFNEGL